MTRYGLLILMLLAGLSNLVAAAIWDDVFNWAWALVWAVTFSVALVDAGRHGLAPHAEVRS